MTERPRPQTDDQDDNYLILGGNRVLRCHATNSKGERCWKPALRGMEVCTTHGGRAPQVKAAAERRLAAMEAERELEQVAKRFGLATDVSPAVALLEEVRRTARIVA